jgi:hypothetical protein
MKLPVQPLELRHRDEPNLQLTGRLAGLVRPAGEPECTICKVACQALPGLLKAACLAACEATVC